MGRTPYSGRQKKFKVEKQMRKDEQDVNGNIYIKDERVDILTACEVVANSQKEIFEELLSKENSSHFEDFPPTEGPIVDINWEEINRALSKIKREKVPGPSCVASDLLKYAVATRLEAPTMVFQKVIKKEISPTK